MAGGEFEYLTVEDILTLHETILHADDSTEPGVTFPWRDTVYRFDRPRGPFWGRSGDGPRECGSISAIIDCEPPFVDGNKRTALVSTVTFYALNGYSLDYGSEIRSLLKRLATDESTVPLREIVEYLAANTAELSPETQARYDSILSIASRHTLRRNDYTDEETT